MAFCPSPCRVQHSHDAGNSRWCQNWGKLDQLWNLEQVDLVGDCHVTTVNFHILCALLSRHVYLHIIEVDLALLWLSRW